MTKKLKTTVLRPKLNFTDFQFSRVKIDSLRKTALVLGLNPEAIGNAIDKANEVQRGFRRECLEIGRETLRYCQGKTSLAS